MSYDFKPKGQLHLKISIVKSVLRIVGLTNLAGSRLVTAAICLIIAEVLGILEEIYDDRE